MTAAGHERFTEEEIKEKFEIWLKHRSKEDHEYEFISSFETFDVTAKRVNKFPRMEE
jgi:broad specificity phosphatase PhoE